MPRRRALDDPEPGPDGPDGHDASHDSSLRRTVFVVLGDDDGLATQKIFPSLFNLYRNQSLPESFKVIWFYGRTHIQDPSEAWLRLKSCIAVPNSEDQHKLAMFNGCCEFVPTRNWHDSLSFETLKNALDNLGPGYEKHSRVFCLALADQARLGASDLLRKYCYPENGSARIILEKPPFTSITQYGNYYEYYQGVLGHNWKEEEVFYTDSYLDKNMVKNILTLRFDHENFGSKWDRHHISNVQITFKESAGVQGLHGYYDEVGIIRDIILRYHLQILPLLAMERPASFSTEDIRNERLQVLRKIRALEESNSIFGQYSGSQGNECDGYLDDPSVSPFSRCPTFCSTVAYIDNDRWADVPFILTAGKALNEQKMEIRIQYKDGTSGNFEIPCNELIIPAEPNKAVHTKVASTGGRQRGLSEQTSVAKLDLSYSKQFADLKVPVSYEFDILDAVKIDPSKFITNDDLQARWNILRQLLCATDNLSVDVQQYPKGSRGPPGMDRFASRFRFGFNDGDE